MIISDIKELDKKRCEIYIDGKLAFVLYKGELTKFMICKGRELTDKTLESIFDETLTKRAYLRCIHLLEKKDYSRFQLYRKLKIGKYPECVIDVVLNKLADYGYINDYEYAKRYIEFNINRKSVKQIKDKLFSIGINKDVIERAFQELQNDGIESNEKELIVKLLNKRKYFQSDKNPGEKRKQFNYLLSKGFSMENIIKVLD